MPNGMQKNLEFGQQYDQKRQLKEDKLQRQ